MFYGHDILPELTMPVITANFSKSSSSELSFEEAMLNFNKHTPVSTMEIARFCILKTRLHSILLSPGQKTVYAKLRPLSDRKTIQYGG